MSENNKINPNAPEQYQTGCTVPPKSYGGLIAFLLILLIFFGGIISILSLMNIQLFRLVRTQTSAEGSMHLRSYSAASAQEEPILSEDNIKQSQLGITGHEITPFHQQYYELPQGIYISEIEPGSQCHSQGLRCGDILIAVNGQKITDFDTLNLSLLQAEPGSCACLTVYRDGKEHSFQIPLETVKGE